MYPSCSAGAGGSAVAARCTVHSDWMDSTHQGHDQALAKTSDNVLKDIS